MNTETDFQSPLIIIGAARSGTNIVRDTLVHVPGWKTWNCDEINLISVSYTHLTLPTILLV